MGGAGFEPAKAEPPDLQSGPFGRLGIRPSRPPGSSSKRSETERRAGGESRTHNPRFTKPKLRRLSYAGEATETATAVEKSYYTVAIRRRKGDFDPFRRDFHRPRPNSLVFRIRDGRGIIHPSRHVRQVFSLRENQKGTPFVEVKTRDRPLGFAVKRRIRSSRLREIL